MSQLRDVVLRRGQNRPIKLLITLWFVYFWIAGLQIFPAAILPIITLDIGVDPADASWIVSTVFLGMAVSALPMGILIDRVDTHRAITLGAAFLFVTTFISWSAALFNNINLLIFSRLISGGLIVLIWTGGIDVIGDAFATRSRATAITIYSMSAPAGLGFGHLYGPYLLSFVNWQDIFLILGSLIIISAGTSLRFRNQKESVSKMSPTTPELRSFLKNKSILIVSSFTFVLFSVYIFLNTWLPTYFVEEFSISIRLSGSIVSTLAFIGILSRTSSGFISDRLLDRRRKPILMASLVILPPSLIILDLSSEIYVLVGVLIISGFFIQLGQALVFVYGRELVTDRFTGTIVALVSAAGFFGAFITPILAGKIIRQHGFSTSFRFAIGLSIFALILLNFAPETNPS